MLCLCGALLNPDVAPAALPEPYRQRPSRAAGSFIGPSPVVDAALISPEEERLGSHWEGGNISAFDSDPVLEPRSPRDLGARLGASPN